MDAKLKRAQSLVGVSAGRPEDDFYPTPPEATEALLAVEDMRGMTLEPACGDGAICKVLEKHRIPFDATDMVDRGYGKGGLDFLTTNYDRTYENVITNPPFSLAQEFLERALTLSSRKVALLCKLQFLEGGKRKAMFEKTPLKSVHVFSKRLSMTRGGVKMKNSGMIAFAWFVWDHAYYGKPTIDWL